MRIQCFSKQNFCQYNKLLTNCPYFLPPMDLFRIRRTIKQKIGKKYSFHKSVFMVSCHVYNVNNKARLLRTFIQLKHNLKNTYWN